MYVGAALMLVVALVVCDYIDALPDFPSKFRFHAVLVLTVTVGYLCIAIACMEKYNVLKRKNRVLEEALTEKEQEKVSILMEWKSHATLTPLAKQDLPTFGYNMIAPLKSWCWGSILFYPFKISRFS